MTTTHLQQRPDRVDVGGGGAEGGGRARVEPQPERLDLAGLPGQPVDALEAAEARRGARLDHLRAPPAAGRHMAASQPGTLLSICNICVCACADFLFLVSSGFEMFIL